ncbi:MAG TPA: hypothetical protein VNQ78_11250 [Paracoccus sp. (in: a-proteobacteria)]|uniref:hypothetical protein n=1 Tax=Paracoccus sp. TaxID=267 RepID=UPI002C410D77|nr:hypothetical protein [Paracoccus sp. (in: a-proteobacteria)]HWL57229.1 hypothetical protein [Paracoccus sp. (in: a-proteobacteria)]
MLRVVLLALSTLLAVPAVAEQAAFSGMPAPKNQKEWHRAVKVRLNANGTGRWLAQGPERLGAGKRTALLGFTINPDGNITSAKVVAASKAIPPEAQARIAKSVEAMPRMPAFTPDMPPTPRLVIVPLRIN